MNDLVTIREIALTDGEAAAKLSTELGYPASADAMGSRIEAIGTLSNRSVYVACVSGVVVGWIDVAIVQHLQSEPYGEIGGLIVSNDWRNHGIGKKLLLQAERWVFADKNINRIVVRSQIARERAHRFYLREGYTRTKTSAVFSKDVMS